jgi:hypothetical protein
VEALTQQHDKIDLNSTRSLAIWTTIVVGVSGLFRLGELVGEDPFIEPVTQGALTFCRTPEGQKYANLHLKGSKSDPFANGVDIRISALNVKECHSLASRCPIVLLKRLLKTYRGLGFLKTTSPLFLTETGIKLNKKDITQAMASWFKNSLRPGAQFKGHSLRRGGATNLFNANVSADTIQRLGRWKTDAYKVYLEPDLGHLLDAQRCGLTEERQTHQDDEALQRIWEEDE